MGDPKPFGPRARFICDLPADNPAGKQIGHERGIHKTAGRIDIDLRLIHPVAERLGVKAELALTVPAAQRDAASWIP